MRCASYKLLDSMCRQLRIPIQQNSKCIIDLHFALQRCQFHDRQVFLDRSCRQLLLQNVVSHPKSSRRKEILAISVTLECPWFPHEPANHVSVVDLLLASTSKSWETFHQRPTVPDFQILNTQPNINKFTDQTTGNRVRIPIDSHCAPDPHADSHTTPTLETPNWQRAQFQSFRLQASLAAKVSLSP